MKAHDLYKPQRGADRIEQDIILAHALELCFNVHKHSKSVVCYPCQVEAFNAYREA